MRDEKAIQVATTFLNLLVFELLEIFFTRMVIVICSLHKLKGKKQQICQVVGKEVRKLADCFEVV